MEYESLSALESACGACRACPLGETRTRLVFGVGPEQTPLVFVGEGPGKNEDLEGEPFVGAAGQLLDDMLDIFGLSRRNCYIANIVKCRPPNNRDPERQEIDACSAWLREQLRLLNPKIIVCLGRIAAKELIDPEFRITRDHGKWYEVEGTARMAIYHPSALLRDESKRPDTYQDLRGLLEKLRALCPDFPLEDWPEGPAGAWPSVPGEHSGV